MPSEEGDHDHESEMEDEIVELNDIPRKHSSKVRTRKDSNISTPTSRRSKQSNRSRKSIAPMMIAQNLKRTTTS